jgi:hypothetical protein
MRPKLRSILIPAVLVAGAGLGFLNAQPNRISVYTFSRDSEKHLNDERLDTFRRELGEYAEPVMELAYSRERAHVTVLYLGQGRLAVELDEAGLALRHLWTPDEKAKKMWAVLRMGNFSKEFSQSGSGGRDLGRLAKSIGDWLQANSTVIREQMP